MVMFGATGDLAKRKLYAALYSLYRNKLLHEKFAVIGVGRSSKEPDAFHTYIRECVDQFGRLKVEDEHDWRKFIEHFAYARVDVSKPEDYQILRQAVESQEKKWGIAGNRLFYMAIAPELFGMVSTNLKNGGLTQTSGWKRLVIEKPFGKDYLSAKALNEEIEQTFSEEEIYRIDHYLGKEMVQNIEVIRFANSLFEPLWNNNFIKNIQITASETVGVEERAAYYEHAGALRDMVQNHMLQMLMMVCMEPPSALNMEAIRDEKVKVLRSLRRYQVEEVDNYFVRGQYAEGTINGQPVPGYRQEHNVAPESATETFVAGKLFIDNFRWAGVPIFIRTGKRMAKKMTEIVIEFKEMPKYLYFNREGNLNPNLLVIRINPDEGLSLILNAKRPGTEDDVSPIELEFCNNCGKESPEAYERLFYDAIEGDSTFFTRWDEVALAWKFVDPIRQAWDKAAADTLFSYQAGSWGPLEVERLLAPHGAHWWQVQTGREQLNAAADKQVKVLT
ncbi:glucose-6-phosphate dehydrogenase [Brevibacillus fulvus]|nr:glucose-6-phosphate dehydrogenase [Brevibacillus fulvus]